MSEKPEIDVTLVAGRRPELLAVTLRSFQDRLFRNFAVRRFVANIDPIWGDASDGDACAQLIRSHFPAADISRPAGPSFGQAVRSVWSRTADRPVLHMEDDWTVLADVDAATMRPLAEPGVGMVMLAQRPRAPGEPSRVMRDRKTRAFGVTVGVRRVNGYGTSPRFIAPGLAARYAELLDPRLDPEKQVYSGRNRALRRLQETFRCLAAWTPEGEPLIEDIGRDWREARDIRKINRRGEVRWTLPRVPAAEDRAHAVRCGARRGGVGDDGP